MVNNIDLNNTSAAPKVFVTGATGLVGAHLVYELVNKGYSVTALYRTDASLQQTVAIGTYYGKRNIHQNIKWVKGDVCDYYSLLDALEEGMLVYHCAAMVSFDKRDKKSLFDVNEQGTANLVQACMEKKVGKLCYVSSIGTLGSPANGHFIDEETAWQSDDKHSVYSLSKFKAEMEVWRATKEGLNAVVVNPGVILGPGDMGRSSGALFGRVKKGMSHYTNGITGFVDVRDVVAFMVMVMESDVSNQRFVLVSENLSYKQVLLKMADALGVEAPQKEATPLMTSLAWRLNAIATVLLGVRSAFTRENARTSHAKSMYSSQKAIQQGFDFTPIDQTILDTAKWINTTGASA